MANDTSNEVLKPQQSNNENSLQQHFSGSTRKGSSSAFLGAIARARASIAERLSKNRGVETSSKEQFTDLTSTELKRAKIGREQFESLYNSASPELRVF